MGNIKLYASHILLKYTLGVEGKHKDINKREVTNLPL